jgi:hypothetical protein
MGAFEISSDATLEAVAIAYQITANELAEMRAAVNAVPQESRKAWTEAHRGMAEVALACGVKFGRCNELMGAVPLPTMGVELGVWVHHVETVKEKLKAEQKERDKPTKQTVTVPSRMNWGAGQELKEQLMANADVLKFKYASSGTKQWREGGQWKTDKGTITYYGQLNAVQDRSYALLDTTVKTFTSSEGVEYDMPFKDTGIYVAFNLLEIVAEFPQGLPPHPHDDGG